MLREAGAVYLSGTFIYSLININHHRVLISYNALCCQKSSFGYAGAMKLDECVRALNSMFVRYSTIPIRGKFSRLREILQVLTSDISSGISSVSVDTYSHLTANEVQAFVALRVDAPAE
jgi:hypothetical protein